METRSENIRTKDGFTLLGRCWLPDQDIVQVICMVHGLGEHIDRYDDFASFFCKKGIAVYGMDMRGHGKSAGKRGHIPTYEAVMLDIEELLKWARVENHDTPIVLYGHSLGGNYVTHFVLNDKNKELAAVIISAPWLELAISPPKFKVTLAKLMNSVFPTYSNDSQLDPKGLSHDQQVVKNYTNDPLVHHIITAKLFWEASKHGQESMKNAKPLTIPALIMHGEDDPITSATASKSFAEKANIDLKIWQGMLHEIHNEIGRGDVYQYVINWLNRNVV